MGGIWGIYKPEPTHLEGVKIVACRGSVIQGSDREKKKKKAQNEEERSSGRKVWQRRNTLEKKVLCLRSPKRGGAGLARELWSDKRTCREMGIKGLCLNKRIPSVFTRFFCPGPFVLLRAMVN